MGHMVGKDLYRKLGKKIDGQTLRAPWNDKFYAILKELYTSEEADLIVRMPYGMSDLDRIEQVTGYPQGKLTGLLNGLAEKGLIIDVHAREKSYFLVSPFVVGIFEFTMMRTRGELNTREWAQLFNEYMQDGDTFYRKNLSKGQKVFPLRALPYEETVAEPDFVEILDYEKASAIVEKTKKFAVGICSCRHEKMHLGEKKCDIPLETCTSFGASADYLIRHGLANEVSRGEMKENLARSREAGLVLCADNVKQDISFICHCCGCCCNVLLGVSKFGYPNAVVTSNYIARSDEDTCLECGECTEACPVNAITNGGLPKIDEDICLGCGVCALNCESESMKLVKREQRVLHPENTFQRVILQSLEQGTLQNLLFANPQSASQGFMRGFVGGFLKLPPVKKALMSDTLRSSFLEFMSKGH